MIKTYPKAISITILITVFFILNRISHSTGLDDPAWHHVDEIYARMFALQDSLPDWVRVDSIGHSQQDRIPIYAIKINRDVHNDLSERPVIVLHDLHAEEVIGIEFMMWFIEKLVAHEDSKSSDWFTCIDTWIIPTSNPEGVNVVYSLDPSWRKNKRNNLKDGRFRYYPGWGSDTAGVDLNRNFPLFWSHGDGFLRGKGNELYDYYRGPGPLSEAEAKALDRFVDKYRPFYLVTLHSSRTGNFAERIFYPWGRGALHYSTPKFSPDIHTLNDLTAKMAARTWKISSPGKPYLCAPISSWVGECDSYFYWKYGTFAMRVEIGSGGAEGMQPDSAGIMKVIESCHKGIEYLFNNTAGTGNTADDGAPIDQIRIDIKTTINGEPTMAIIDFKALTSAIMPYRETSPMTGMYNWLVLDGFTDTLTVRKYGYYTRRGLAWSQQSGSAPLRIDMEPLPAYSVTLQAITSDSAAIQDDVELEIRHLRSPGYIGWGASATPEIIEVPLNYPNNEWLHVMNNGEIQLELPEGDYSFTFINSERNVPRRIEIDVDADMTKQVILSDAVVLLNQNFDSGDVLYTSDNINNPNGDGGDSLRRWELANDIFHSSPRCLTDS